MNKNDIRNKIKALRNNFSIEELYEKSIYITNAFFSIYSHLNIFLLYYPVNNEVNTIPLISNLYKSNKQIYLPAVVGREIFFKKFEGFDKLLSGKFGIYEPSGEVLRSKPDIICVPGVAFDEKCNRIGYGGGFYDRYLSNTSIISSAFAYEFQIIDNIVTEHFDIPVNEIFTEKRIIRRV